MPHDHGHHHHHHHVDASTGDARLAWAVAVNLLLTVAQIAGGLLSGSVALIADAIHNLSDALSLVIAFAARRIARRPADGEMTFGYGRAELIAALVNLTTLVVIGVWLLGEAGLRLLDPPEVAGWPVVILAGVALVVDLATVMLTGGMKSEGANVRAAYLHNLADALSSVAVIVAGTLILLYDWRLVDPLVTLGIALYILWHAGQEIGPVIRILMLGSPAEMETEAVRAALMEVEGVAEVDHLHLWQIDERKVSVEAHVVCDPGAPEGVRARLKAALDEGFGIRHSTLELRHGEEGLSPGCAPSR